MYDLIPKLTPFLYVMLRFNIAKHILVLFMCVSSETLGSKMKISQMLECIVLSSQLGRPGAAQPHDVSESVLEHALVRPCAKKRSHTTLISETVMLGSLQ